MIECQFSKKSVLKLPNKHCNCSLVHLAKFTRVLYIVIYTLDKNIIGAPKLQKKWSTKKQNNFWCNIQLLFFLTEKKP